MVVTHHLQPVQLLQDVSRGAALLRGAPASHGGVLPSVVLVSRGQAGGGVDGQVGVLGQSDQGDVVTHPAGGLVVGGINDQVNVEILRDQRLVLGVQLVLTQPDFQGIFREILGEYF